MLARSLILLAGLAAARAFRAGCSVARSPPVVMRKRAGCSVARSPPVVMRKVDDTVRAAKAEAEREVERARLEAEEAADPEPGPCPSCGDAGTYWDGMVTFGCTRCGHEWGFAEAQEAAEEYITRDVNGAELSSGDQVVLTKDLAGGKLKKGTKVKVKLGDFGDGHDLEAVIPSKGTYALKSEFVKKAG